MKKIMLALTLCASIVEFKSQNSFGIIEYSHTNSNLSDGKVTSINPGFITAGFETAVNTYNFTLDRMDAGGTPGGNTYEFRKGYTISINNSACSTPFTQINNGTGVSVIESTSMNDYGVVGACTDGCYFVSIGNTGAITPLRLFRFPAGTVNVSKPLITESTASPGNFFIVGSYDGVMYILNVTATGGVNSKYTSNLTNSFSLLPMAIIESPYGTNPLTIVGVITSSGGADGFFYQIPFNVASGPSLFKSYNLGTVANTNNGLTSITLATPSAGFVVAGYAPSPLGAQGNAWFMELSGNGTLSWSSVITGATSPAAGKIYGVIERYSSFYSAYELYGACQSNSGITIYKLTTTGGAFSASHPGTNDEFVYNTASNSSTWPVNLSYTDNTSLPDNGLHIYGNRENTGLGHHYFVEAYFNGVTANNCHLLTNISSVDNSNPTTTNINNVSGTVLSECINFGVGSTNLTPYTAHCGPVSSVVGGSLNKTSSIHELLKEETIFSIFNTTNHIDVVIKSLTDVTHGSVQLYNELGQIIDFKTPAKTTIENQYKVEFELNENTNAGIYFIQMNSDIKSVSKKFIYTRN
jgi:hypothetical protein